MPARSVERLDRHLKVRAGGGNHVRAGVDDTEADEAGLRDGLPVVGVADRDVAARRPVSDLADLVAVLRLGDGNVPSSVAVAARSPMISRITWISAHGRS
jgi:hypothetical protein